MLVTKNIKTDHWPTGPKHPTLDQNQAHIWAVDTKTIHTPIETLYTLLDDTEKKRANRFFFEPYRACFIMARAILRKLLGAYLGQPPKSLSFEYNAYGKPQLSPKHGKAFPELNFNLSHSEEYIIYAFSNRPIGIDLEVIKSSTATKSMAKRILTTREYLSWENLQFTLRDRSFFWYWTCKEAFVKALGQGLSYRIKHIEITFRYRHNLPPEVANLHLYDVEKNPKNWPITLLNVWPNCACACAVEGHLDSFMYWIYAEST